MNKDIAERIKKLRTQIPIHSWRRIAEIYVHDYPHLAIVDGDIPDLAGNQLYGIFLVEKAAETLGEHHWDWEDLVEELLK